MFSVIFEVHVEQERLNDYLSLAQHLKPILEKIDGFIDNERFKSQRRPGWLLSHSTWRDEKSVVRWRTRGEHHAAQEKGRSEIFAFTICASVMSLPTPIRRSRHRSTSGASTRRKWAKR